jgi:alanyl-tRNA synthetase
MCEKLYEADAYLAEFTATVLDVKPEGEHFWIALDRTAFFPEGGGQAGDLGYLGDTRVSDTQEKDGNIYHKTDRALPIGATVCGRVDFAVRFDRMQNHSGEHIVSGLVHRHYGYDNVGFHLGDEEMTLDFSGPLTREQLDAVEDEANAAVFANLPITVSYPASEALASIDYRAKLALTEGVRLVTVVGIDVCACCAPHVRRTGEIGLIKLLDFIRYKGGVRIRMACGSRALADYREKSREVAGVSRLLSLPQADCAAGVERLCGELAARKTAYAALMQELTALRVANLHENESGNLLYFATEEDAIALRQAALLGAERAHGLALALYGEDGSGYRVMIASRTLPLTDLLPTLRERLAFRGGGSKELLQGQTTATRKEIEAFFENSFRV